MEFLHLEVGIVALGLVIALITGSVWWVVAGAVVAVATFFLTEKNPVDLQGAWAQVSGRRPVPQTQVSAQPFDPRGFHAARQSVYGPY